MAAFLAQDEKSPQLNEDRRKKPASLKWICVSLRYDTKEIVCLYDVFSIYNIYYIQIFLIIYILIFFVNIHVGHRVLLPRLVYPFLSYDVDVTRHCWQTRWMSEKVKKRDPLYPPTQGRFTPHLPLMVTWAVIKSPGWLFYIGDFYYY